MILPEVSRLKHKFQAIYALAVIMVIKVNYIPLFNFVYKAALFSRIFEANEREKSFGIK